MENTVQTRIRVGVTKVSDERTIGIRPRAIKLEHGGDAGADTAMLGNADFS